MRGDTTPSTDCGSSEPALIFPYRSGFKDVEHPLGLQRKSRTRALAGPIVRLRSRRKIARIVVAIAAFICPMAASTAGESNVHAQTVTRSQNIRFAEFIGEASARFAVAATLIHAVLQVESGGDQRASSPRGALGLMQLMPGTWVELSARYELGLDPFDPHDNIFAGAAYLKEMYDRFGSAGFLAAYHAGPARYEQHLATGKSLPPDTIAYVAAVRSVLAQEQGEHTAVDGRRALPWREAPLFVERAGAP